MDAALHLDPAFSRVVEAEIAPAPGGRKGRPYIGPGRAQGLLLRRPGPAAGVDIMGA